MTHSAYNNSFAGNINCPSLPIRRVLKTDPSPGKGKLRLIDLKMHFILYSDIHIDKKGLM